MTREIKMLLAVAAGAALAGWLVVRLVAPPAETPVAAPPAETDEPVAVEPREQLEEKDEDGSAPRELAASKEPDPDEDPSDEIARDLDILVRAVRKDKHVHNQSFPDDNTILEIPSLVPYIRKVNFWQPAFEKASEDAKGDG